MTDFAWDLPGLVERLREGPAVPAWMLRPPGPVLAAARGLSETASQVDGAGLRLERVLSESAGVLGWRSDGAMVARGQVERAGGQVGRLRETLLAAGSALELLTKAIEEHGELISSLRRQRSDLMLQLLAATAELAVPRLPAGITNVVNLDGARRVRELIAQIQVVDRRITSEVDTLSDLDRRCRRGLDEALDDLRTMTGLRQEDAWVATAAPDGLVMMLGRYGVTETQRDQALLDRIMFLPIGADGDARVRGLLGDLPPAELAAFLQRHPAVGRRLLGPLGSPPPGSPAAILAAAVSNAGGLPPKQQIAAVRAAFAALDADEVQRLALLYPGVVGNLDGAPVSARVAANRVAIAVALDHERTRLTGLERAVLDQGKGDRWWADLNDKAEIVADIGDAPDARDNAVARIAYYQRLLYEEPLNPNYVPGSGRPVAGPHQILFFDPSGDGRIAELWGSIDADIRHVGVFVPGTTTDLDSFEHYSDKMMKLASQDLLYGTAMVAWMGVDLPDAVVANAPDARYAEAGGPALRDFVWALDVPSTADVTAIGHSYGGALVGVADRDGLEVQRIVHVESAGAGHNVFSISDYPNPDIDRYTMTAPGDVIDISQGVQAPRIPLLGHRSVDPLVGHGGDPDDIPGFVRLETGRYGPGGERAGQIIEGVSSHTEVLTADSTAWNNIFQVVEGGEVIPYAPRFYTTTTVPNPFNPHSPIVHRTEHSPYEDPKYPDPAPVDIR